MQRPGQLLVLAAVAGWTLGGTGHAACPAPVAATRVSSVVRQAESAFIALDAVAFSEAATALDRDLPCVDTSLTPSLAGSVHRIHALAAFLSRDFDNVAIDLAAYRHAMGGEGDLSDLVPPEHPLNLDLNLVDLGAGSFVQAEVPPSARTVFDGVVTNRRPRDWPTLLQVLDESGAVTQTVVLRKGEPMPDLADAPAADAPAGTNSLDDATTVPEAQAPRSSRGLLAAGAVTGVVAGGLLAANRVCYAQYAAGEPLDGTSGAATCSRVTYVSTAGSGVAALGLGLAAVFVGRW